MSAFVSQVLYLATHPQAIIYEISTSLLYPLMFVELAALIFIAVDFGLFTAELIGRFRKRSLAQIESQAFAARKALRAGDVSGTLAQLEQLTHGQFVKRFVESLGDGSGITNAKLLKLLNDLELAASKRLETTRVLVRLGPIVGLMTTFIPISPALVGLAKGDVQTLSNNLVIAFSTTVAGLLIGGMAYLMTAVRDRLYTQDISDVEYVLEILEN